MLTYHLDLKPFRLATQDFYNECPKEALRLRK